MSEVARVLKIKNIYLYWRLEKESPRCTYYGDKSSIDGDNEDDSDAATNKLLYVNKPAVAKPKGRSTGVKNKKKKKRTREKSFEDST